MILSLVNPQFDIFIFGLIGLVAWFLLLRAAVRADNIKNRLTEMVNEQKATNWLLIKLCEKQGVSKEDIDTIKNIFKIK